MDDSTHASRRQLLKGAMLLAGASLSTGLGVTDSFAQTKASKEAMKYQDKPSAEKQCSNCLQFVAPDSCKIVEGAVSPSGYCIAWVKK
jgi:hypothetical protein